MDEQETDGTSWWAAGVSEPQPASAQLQQARQLTEQIRETADPAERHTLQEQRASMLTTLSNEDWATWAELEDINLQPSELRALVLGRDTPIQRERPQLGEIWEPAPDNPSVFILRDNEQGLDL